MTNYNQIIFLNQEVCVIVVTTLITKIKNKHLRLFLGGLVSVKDQQVMNVLPFWDIFT